jgi:nitrite reductase/ring-hydroxylating ferredoxin subunit
MMTHEDPLTRRAVLLGVGVASAAVLTGCARYGPGTGAVAGDDSHDAGSLGDGSSGDGAADRSGDGSGGAGNTAGSLATSAVPVGGGVVLGERGVVVTQPKSGQFKAFTAVCTHQGCTVAEVRNGTINCPCHGSRFSADDGSVVHGPASRPLRPLTIAVSGSNITLP